MIRRYRVVTGIYPDEFEVEVEKRTLLGGSTWVKLDKGEPISHDGRSIYGIRGAYYRWFPPFDSEQKARECIADFQKLDNHIVGEPL